MDEIIILGIQFS